MRLPVGVSDFEDLVEGNYDFVDKTLLIKDIINDGSKVILITRPRRFGKTLNLSMLKYFFEENRKKGERNLFEGLNISKEEALCAEHQHKYPVIFVSFKDIKALNYERAYADVAELIRGLYAEHRYLLEGEVLKDDEKRIFKALLNKEATESDITISIKQLSGYMERKFGKQVILLIDEYDTPIQEAYVNGYYTEMIRLMRGIFGYALKDNKSLGKAVMTGITRVSQESMFSDLNNIQVYSLLREEYGQYFGFTEDEVKALVSKSEHKISLDLLKEWYNGYQIGRHVIYNPWSIINCLKNKGSLEPYWVNTSSNAMVGTLLDKAGLLVKDQLEALMQGNEVEQVLVENLVFADVERGEESLWSLLLYAGYLNVLSSERRGNQLFARIAIPNKEVSFVYGKIIENWFRMATSLTRYFKFIESLGKGDVETFKRYLSDYIMQTGSYFDFNKNTAEEVFHVFILGLVSGLKEDYEIHSNKEAGLGRYDMVFVPKKRERNGIILEFKTGDREELLKEKAEEALEQIKDRRYMEIFKGVGVKVVLAIGMAFCGKRVEVVSELVDCR